MSRRRFGLLSLPTTADRKLISYRLNRFYALPAAKELPEAHRLAETIEAWWPAVDAAIITGYSNARSGGYNPPGQARRQDIG